MLLFRLFAIVLAVQPMPALAETFDPTFASDGRLLFSVPGIDFRSVAALPMPNGEVVMVYERPMDGECADAVCIGLSLRSATGNTTAIPARTKAAGLTSVTGAAVDRRGRIVVVGATANGPNGKDFGIVRFRADLTDDTSFAGGGVTTVSYNTGNEFPTAVAIDARDNIVVVGSFSITGTDSDFGVVRVRSNGSLDTSFNGTGKRALAFDLGSGLLLDQANAVAIGNDGRIVIAGTAIDGTISRTRIGIARLNTDGSLDTSFCNPDCSTNAYPGIHSGATTYYFGNFGGHSDEALAVDVLGNGRIVLAGTSYADDGSSRQGAIARLNADGSFSAEYLEYGFGGGNAVFRGVRSADANGTRLMVAGDSGSSQQFLLVQAFDTALRPLVAYSNCQTDDSGFCFNIGTGFGDSGPDSGRALNLDAQGRPLFIGDGARNPGQV